MIIECVAALVRPGQLGSSYALIHDIGDAVPVGIAVQDGNLAEVNKKTGRRVTARELLEFASNYLGADFIFWGIEEPYFSDDVVPTIAKLISPALTTPSTHA
ncbi:MAG TPA: hypothetical protein VJL35_10860 [Gemmatimonadaceae bacterium]|nr:hypothetical protein [Gemmatimonadaceae bacterium]